MTTHQTGCVSTNPSGAASSIPTSVAGESALTLCREREFYGRSLIRARAVSDKRYHDSTTSFNVPHHRYAADYGGANAAEQRRSAETRRLDARTNSRSSYGMVRIHQCPGIELTGGGEIQWNLNGLGVQIAHLERHFQGRAGNDEHDL